MSAVAKVKNGRQGEGGGRPSLFNQAILDEICKGLEEGKTLTAVCKGEFMPAPRTVWMWREQDPEVFARLARARKLGCDAIQDQALDIADTPMLGVERTVFADGSEQVKHVDMLGHRRLQVDTRLKAIAKWDPDRYGDKSGTTVNVGVQVTNISVTEEQMAGIREKLRLANERSKAVQ